MKRKFSSMGRVAIALVLALSLSMVMAVPAAADVTDVTVEVAPVLTGDVAQYSINFTNTQSIPGANWIKVTFPNDTVVPPTYETGDIILQGTGVAGGDVSGEGATVTIVIPDSIAADTEITVVFTLDAGIVNPTQDEDLSLKVSTEVEPIPVDSTLYDILALPVVSDIEPDEGNVDDTMWVEVTGNYFTGDAATNECTTTLNFGDGITVLDSKYVAEDSIDCQITINVAGTVAVAADTDAGIGDETYPFTANDADTPQVDVWDTYDITATLFEVGTLEFNADPENPYATITEAMGVTSTGDVVWVHAAIYEESVVIGQDITLQSIDGKATTIIDASGASTAGIDIQAGGVTVEGFTVALDGAMVDGIRISTTAPGVTVQNNSITDPGFTGVKFEDVVTGAKVLNNVISDSDLGIFVKSDSTHCLLEGNEITDSGGDRPSGIRLDGGFDGDGTENITIKENDITGNINCGIVLFSDWEIEGDDIFTDIWIEGNTISGAHPYGIETWGDLTITGLVIIKNDISGSWEDGIRIRSWDATSVISYNNLYGNGLYGSTTGGLKNKSGQSVDARYNWWGEMGGPGANTWPDFAPDAGTALGKGDIVSNMVLFEPWLTRDQDTAITSGIAYHGSTMVLEPGWNTLSVPLELDASANTIAEIMDLGDFITNLNVDVVYQYNPELPGWENIATGAVPLVPGRGYYIEVLGTADVNFPVLYSGTLGLPTLELPAGWNLIGSGFGIDKSGVAATWVDATPYTIGEEVLPPTPNGFRYICTVAGTSGGSEPSWPEVEGARVEDGTSTPKLTWTALWGEYTDYGVAVVFDLVDGKKQVSEALDSIADSCSVVVSPTMPGQTAAWAGVVTGTNPPMIVGEGYWVFMTDTATLAGFEVTPIYWIR